MRVGLDGRDLLRKRTGVVNYAVHLSRALRYHLDVELRVYADGFNDPAVAPPPEVPLVRLRAPGPTWKHVRLPVALWQDRLRLFHSPTGTLPTWSPCPQVVTLHDLLAAVEPRWFPSGASGRLLLASQARAAHAAVAIIAVSERTRQDIVARFGVPADRICTIYNGVDHDRFYPSSEDDPAVTQAILARHGVRQPFVLCVGSLMPWRNATRLTRALARVKARHGLPHQLLFVGRDIWGTDSTQRLARDEGWDWVRFSGYVSDDDLPPLYRAAAAFAYPSLYEGFGIPPLEAMACGIPVVASNAGSLPEVLGDAAFLPDPTDEEAIAQALATVLLDEAERTRLQAAGLERAARYTWATAAEQTVRLYQQLVP